MSSVLLAWTSYCDVTIILYGVISCPGSRPYLRCTISALALHRARVYPVKCLPPPCITTVCPLWDLCLCPTPRPCLPCAHACPCPTSRLCLLCDMYPPTRHPPPPPPPRIIPVFTMLDVCPCPTSLPSRSNEISSRCPAPSQLRVYPVSCLPLPCITPVFIRQGSCNASRLSLPCEIYALVLHHVRIYPVSCMPSPSITPVFSPYNVCFYPASRPCLHGIPALALHHACVYHVRCLPPPHPCIFVFILWDICPCPTPRPWYYSEMSVPPYPTSLPCITPVISLRRLSLPCITPVFTLWDVYPCPASRPCLPCEMLPQSGQGPLIGLLCKYGQFLPRRSGALRP